MRRNAFIVGALVVAVVGLTAGPAAALTKIRSTATLSDHFVLSGFCAFPVTATDIGTPPTVVETLDANGDLLRIDILPHGPLHTTFEANGLSVTVNNNGPITIAFKADGTVTITQRGQSVTGDTGDLTAAPLLRHTSGRVLGPSVIDPDTGGFLFQSLTFAGSTLDICAALTP
jgi:hypothetical protein